MLTRNELLLEIDEKSKDLQVFLQARDLIRQRVIELVDSQSSLTPLPQWSGTDAVLGCLDLAVHSIERTLDELRALADTLESKRPTFRVITGDLDEHGEG
jgi:hypothetical protein